jgi:hypothetical protein
MEPADLGDQLLDAVHAGAQPIPASQRSQYFNLVARWLDSCSMVTPRSLADQIRKVQSELLRPVVLD